MDEEEYNGESEVSGHELDFDFDELDEPLVKSLKNESSYLGKTLSTNVKVPGNIGNPKYYDFWKTELKAPEFVLKTISEGYRLPFASVPPPSFTRNNRSALRERDFMKAELYRLEQLGCISRVESRPYVVLPLSVVFSRKLRLVVDASRGLNPFLVDRKVRLENLEVAEMTLSQGEWQTKSDLDSGKFHSGS